MPPLGEAASRMEHQQIATSGVRVHVVHAGPPDGPLVPLRHGLPGSWYGWHHQLPFLAAAGYRVWAPDQRGYYCSDTPTGGCEGRCHDPVPPHAGGT
jgi:epoxide hydrolase 4